MITSDPAHYQCDPIRIIIINIIIHIKVLRKLHNYTEMQYDNVYCMEGDMQSFTYTVHC